MCKLMMFVVFTASVLASDLAKVSNRARTDWHTLQVLYRDAELVLARS